MNDVPYEQVSSMNHVLAKEKAMRNVFTDRFFARSKRPRRTRGAAPASTVDLRRTALVTLTLTIAAGLVGPALAGGGSRAVVVHPQPGGAAVPVGPDEKVGAVTVVDLPTGSAVVVRVDRMPPKPDFNIITPDGVSHPFVNDDHWTWSAQSIHHPDGTESYIVRGSCSEGGTVTTEFPPGSRAVPDPPQPPGLAFRCPDEFPVEPAEEAYVLALLGMPDNPEPEVWFVPSGEFWFTHDAWPEPLLVRFGMVPPPVQVSGLAKAPNLAAGAASFEMTRGWAERFDRYAAGGGLHGQGGWKGWDDDPTLDAQVSDARSYSYANSVDIADGTDLVREFDGYSSGKWIFSALQYIPADFEGGGSDPLAGTFLVMLNTYADGGPHQESDWSIQLQFDSNDGMLKVYYGDGMNTVDVPYVPDAWVPIKLVIDLDNDLTRIFYDRQFIVEYSWTGGVLGGGGGAAHIAALNLFANGSSSVYYDNLLLKSAPGR